MEMKEKKLWVVGEIRNEAERKNMKKQLQQLLSTFQKDITLRGQNQ